jgi:hypothetical protein
LSFANDTAGLPESEVPGLPWHPKILTNHLILFQQVGADYAHHITTGIPGFLNLPTTLETTIYILIIIKYGK